MDGTLDPRDYNIQYHRPTPEQRRAGILYIILIIVVIIACCLLIIDFVPY
jgi:hypothetical protein